MNSLLSPQVEKFITKSTKWTNWDYWSPQVEKFITKWTNWDYLSPQVDEFIIKSTRTSLLQNPQSGWIEII